MTGAEDATFREWSVLSEELFQSEIHLSQDRVSIKVCALNTPKDMLALGLENGDIEFYQKDEFSIDGHSGTVENPKEALKPVL